MSRAGDPPVRNEGRRGSRIDFDEGGGYHGIPPQSSIRAFPSVQRIGCGTLAPIATFALGLVLFLARFTAI